MSSQDNSGIPISHAPDGRGYKLLELPPELQSLLEAEDAPVLTLSSSPAAALLITPLKTYSLRQKNTSNALMLLSPSSGSSSNSSATPPPTSPPSMSQIPTGQVPVRVIATVHETIELVVEPEPGAEISSLKSTGSKGKWHEKFGRGR